MKKEEKFNSTFSSNNGRVYIINLPNVCPLCGSKIAPIVVGGYNDYLSKKLFVMYYCNGCNKTFISEYLCLNDYATTYKDNYAGVETKYIESYPLSITKECFSEDINKISPRFEKIYNQALESEKRNLDELSGIGYRKALEFLIKDYIKYYNLSGDVSIDVMNLQKCINDYIDDDTIKNLTTACTWLGNDHTHYVVKYNDYTIEDIKKYLYSAISILEGKIRSKDLINSLLHKEQ